MASSKNVSIGGYSLITFDSTALLYHPNKTEALAKRSRKSTKARKCELACADLRCVAKRTRK